MYLKIVISLEDGTTGTTEITETIGIGRTGWDVILDSGGVGQKVVGWLVNVEA